MTYRVSVEAPVCRVGSETYERQWEILSFEHDRDRTPLSVHVGRRSLGCGENPFVICSFWLVESLALSGWLDEATPVFETVVGYRSQHDLFAEEMDEETGEHRGNYPQAFSHIGLTNALHTLETAREQHAP